MRVAPSSAGRGKFYPYWTLTSSCAWEFGNMTNGNTVGKVAQYGSVLPNLGCVQLFGLIMKNTCAASGH
jgi:hypothetical protein